MNEAAHRQLKPSARTFGHSLAVEKHARMHSTTRNDVELLVDGEATFKSIFDGIEYAKNYVLVEAYIIRDETS